MGIRIANCSGFFGDRSSAAREMVEGGPIDVLTGDYLAELTMVILARHRMRDPDAGYVPDLPRPARRGARRLHRPGDRVVANAGGLNPPALAGAVGDLAARLGVPVRVATVTGDDLGRRRRDLVHAVTGETMAERAATPLTANAYLGGWGIARALAEGADVVVTGRVADASLVVGPAAWQFGWDRDDWDRLAGAVVAGHVIECGAQATGGNFSFFTEVPGLDEVGFPIADVEEDGSAISPSTPAPAGRSRWRRSPPSCSTRWAGPGTSTPTSWPGSTRSSWNRDGPDRVRISGSWASRPPPPPRWPPPASPATGTR